MNGARYLFAAAGHYAGEAVTWAFCAVDALVRIGWRIIQGIAIGVAFGVYVLALVLRAHPEYASLPSDVDIGSLYIGGASTLATLGSFGGVFGLLSGLVGEAERR